MGSYIQEEYQESSENGRRRVKEPGTQYIRTCPLFLSPVSLRCLSLLLLGPFLLITNGPSPHGGKKAAKELPTERQNSFLPRLIERAPEIDSLESCVCPSDQSVAVAREMGIVIGPTHAHSWFWDRICHLKRRDGKAPQTDKNQSYTSSLELRVRENALE